MNGWGAKFIKMKLGEWELSEFFVKLYVKLFAVR